MIVLLLVATSVGNGVNVLLIGTIPETDGIKTSGVIKAATQYSITDWANMTDLFAGHRNEGRICTQERNAHIN